MLWASKIFPGKAVWEFGRTQSPVPAPSLLDNPSFGLNGLARRQSLPAMKNLSRVGLASVALLFLLPITALAQKKVVAYVPNWIDLPAFAQGIDYAKLTHINIAFENPTNAAGDLSFSRKNSALIAKA